MSLSSQEEEQMIMEEPRCTFCESENHTLCNCDSSLFFDFENALYEKKIRVYSLSDSLHMFYNLAYYGEYELWCVLNRNIEVFKSWVTNNYDFKLIQCYALKNCNAYPFDDEEKIINCITDKFWCVEIEKINCLIQEREQRDEPLSNYLFEIENTSESNITWNIDRIPDLLTVEDLANVEDLASSRIQVFLKEEKELEEKRTVLEECSICYEETEYSNKVKLHCNHEFCGFCVKKIIQKNNHPCCAFCRLEITKIETKTSIMEMYISSL